MAEKQRFTVELKIVEVRTYEVEATDELHAADIADGAWLREYFFSEQTRPEIKQPVGSMGFTRATPPARQAQVLRRP